MNKDFWIYLICFALAVLLCFGFAVNVFASDASEEDWLYPDNTLPSDYNENPYYYETTEDTSTAITDPHGSDLPLTDNIFNTQEDTSVEVPVIIEQDNSQDKFNQDKTLVYPEDNKAVAPITPSNSNGFKAVVLQLLGNYDPVIIEYSYTNSNGYVSYLREVQPDYAWMCSTAIFAIVLYCFFRIIGALIKK